MLCFSRTKKRNYIYEQTRPSFNSGNNYQHLKNSNYNYQQPFHQLQQHHQMGHGQQQQQPHHHQYPNGYMELQNYPVYPEPPGGSSSTSSSHKKHRNRSSCKWHFSKFNFFICNWVLNISTCLAPKKRRLSNDYLPISRDIVLNSVRYMLKNMLITGWFFEMWFGLIS